MMRHTLSWMAMSTTTETRITQAKAAPSCTVKVVVWVRKPGPDGGRRHQEHRAEEAGAPRRSEDLRLLAGLSGA